MKLSVTQELAILIKTVRMQNNVSAKDLASYIGKSASYISKLEGGDVKSIVKEDLTRILSYIVAQKDTGCNTFYKDVLPSIYKVLSAYIEPQRIANQVWLMQYDVVERPVRIPEEMAEEMAKNLKEHNISLDEFCNLINSNIDSEMSSAFPANEIVLIDYKGKSRILIRTEISRETLLSIFEKRDLFISYLMAYNIVYVMFRAVNFPQVMTKLPPENAITILRNASDYMQRYSIHSLTGFSHLLSSPEFINRQKPLADKSFSVSDSTIENIIDILKEASDHDALNTTQQLNIFLNTLQWDPAFAMKLLGINFADLNELSYQNKKNLLEDIQKIVDKYDQLSDFEKKLETY